MRYARDLIEALKELDADILSMELEGFEAVGQAIQFLETRLTEAAIDGCHHCGDGYEGEPCHHCGLKQ
jgi:hypothetical protein